MAAAAVDQPWAALQKGLERKATFETSISECITQLEGHVASTQELRKLLARTLTLLRSRYNNVAFWRKGRQLFQAAHNAVGDPALQRELEGYIAACNDFLGHEEAGPSSEQQPPDQEQQQQWRRQQGFLFEGQLGSAAEPRQSQNPAEMLGSFLPPALAQQLLGQGEGGEGGGTEPPSAQALESLQQELDAIAQRIIEETGQQAAASAAPPASKKVVRSLPKEALTAARLQELGGPDIRCPVCMEELAEGAEVQIMPCKHCFHPPCLAPWLEQHNSCPTCRHELPTDDQQYERRKEREKTEAEERRGAENAISHKEFLYI